MKKIRNNRRSILIKIGQKRFEKSLKRKQKSKAKRKKFVFASHLFNFLKTTLTGKNLFQKNQKIIEIKIPKKFSFYHNPSGVMNILYSLVNIASNKRIERIFFDHSKCTTLDLSASAVMDVMVVELGKIWKSKGKHVIVGGLYPDDGKIRDLLRETGLVQNLHVQGEELTEEKKKQYVNFPLRVGFKDPIKPMKSTMQEIASSDLAKYFDKCLNRIDYELTPTGMSYISKMVGEILVNAEEHSEYHRGEWNVIGYLRQEKNINECNITIFNFGKTIYETLNDEKTDNTLKMDLSDLSKKHERAGFFSASWTRENLWTLYGLQDGVSRHTGHPEGLDRGNGTIKMINFFFNLVGRNRKYPLRMIVMSGKTQILFNGDYLPMDKIINGEKRSVIAFNRENSLSSKPDGKVIKSLNYSFPGTIIDMRFYLDKRHLGKTF